MRTYMNLNIIGMKISVRTLEEIFNNAYLIGSPNENVDCMFSHSKEGAVTICKNR